MTISKEQLFSVCNTQMHPAKFLKSLYGEKFSAPQENSWKTPRVDVKPGAYMSKPLCSGKGVGFYKQCLNSLKR